MWIWIFILNGFSLHSKYKDIVAVLVHKMHWLTLIIFSIFLQKYDDESHYFFFVKVVVLVYFSL